jgi:prepilin-type N-terminal cleavage/methylation domain-containing protein
MLKAKVLKSNESGFTLIELLVVIGIIVVLFALGTINLGISSSTATISSITNSLIADIKNQQILSMTGDAGDQSTQQSHGIYFQSSSYIIFSGASYDPSNTSNFSLSTDPVTLSNTFPSNQIVFAKGNGDLVGFTDGDNTITITEGDASNTLSINRFGAVSIN